MDLQVTEMVQSEIVAWQNRPLEEVHPNSSRVLDEKLRFWNGYLGVGIYVSNSPDEVHGLGRRCPPVLG